MFGSMRELLSTPDALPRNGFTLYTYRCEGGEILFERSQRMPESYDRAKFLRFDPDPRLGGLFRLALSFNFQEPLYSAFERLVDACHHDSMEQIEALDRELETETGISAIRNQLLLEVLVSVSIQTRNYPVAKVLVTKGPPPAPAVTAGHGWFREDAADYLLVDCLSLLAPLFANRWLLPRPHHANWVMMFAHKDEDAMIALFDAFVALGFLPGFAGCEGEPGMRHWTFWSSGVMQAPLTTLRHVAQTMPILPSIPETRAHELVAQTAGFAGREDVLQFLVTEQGLDVNSMSTVYVDSVGRGIPPPGSMKFII